MNSLYYQNRKVSIFNDLESYLMTPDELIGHEDLKNKSPWSPVQFDPARNIIKGRKPVIFVGQGGVTLFSDEKRALKVLKWDKSCEPEIDTDKLLPKVNIETIENDIFIKMPPVNEKIVRMKIESIEKGKMHIVEP